MFLGTMTFIAGWVRACGLGCGMARSCASAWHSPEWRGHPVPLRSWATCSKVLFSDKRPDLVIFNGIGCKNQLTDVVTRGPCRKDICVRAAARAGATAEEAAFGKERSWTAQAEARAGLSTTLLPRWVVPLTNAFASFS